MDLSDIMSALRSKLDAQSTAFQTLLQSSLASHSEAIYSTLHQHLVSVAAKVTNLHAEKSTADSNPAMTVSNSAVNHRFGPSAYEDVEGDLPKPSQSGSVADFAEVPCDSTDAQFSRLPSSKKSFSQDSDSASDFDFVDGSNSDSSVFKLDDVTNRPPCFSQPPTLTWTFHRFSPSDLCVTGNDNPGCGHPWPLLLLDEDDTTLAAAVPFISPFDPGPLESTIPTAEPHEPRRFSFVCSKWVDSVDAVSSSVTDAPLLDNGSYDPGPVEFPQPPTAKIQPRYESRYFLSVSGCFEPAPDLVVDCNGPLEHYISNGASKYVIVLSISAGCDITVGNFVYESPIDGPILWEIDIPHHPFTTNFVLDPIPKYVSNLFVIPPTMFRHYGLWEKDAEHIVEGISYIPEILFDVWGHAIALAQLLVSGVFVLKDLDDEKLEGYLWQIFELPSNVFATADGNPLISHNFRMKFSFTHTNRIWGVGPVSIIAWIKYATNCQMSFIGTKQETDHSIQIGQHVQMNGGGNDNIHDASIPSAGIKHQGDWKYSTFDNFETKALEKESEIVAHGAFGHSGKDAVDQNVFPMMRMMHEAAFNLAIDLKCEFAGAVFAVNASKLDCEVAAINAFAARYPYQSLSRVSNTAQFMDSIAQAEKQLTTLNSVKPKLSMFKFGDHLEHYYFTRNQIEQHQLVQQYAYIDPCSIDGAQLSFTAAFDVVSAYVSLDDGSKYVLHSHWCGVASTILENPNIIIGQVITEMKDSGFKMLAFASRQILVLSKDDILLVQGFITSELGIEVLVECGCLEGKQLTVLNEKAQLFNQVSVIGKFIVNDKLLMITAVVNSLDIDTHDPILALGEHGSCYFSFTNGSLHFKIWDPGGCCFVLWEGLAKLKVSWEDFAAFEEAYPTFHLEDKVSF